MSVGALAAPLSPQQEDKREIDDLFASAPDLVGGQAAAAGATRSPLDLAELVLNALDKGSSDENAAAVAVQAGALLSELNHNQRDVRIYLGDAATAASAYPYSSLKDGYINLLKQYNGPIIGKSELARAANIINCVGKAEVH